MNNINHRDREMTNLYQRMTETLAVNMGDTFTVMQQFEEAIHEIARLESRLKLHPVCVASPDTESQQVFNDNVMLLERNSELEDKIAELEGQKK